jgi:predicted extracellular nuclease
VSTRRVRHALYAAVVFVAVLVPSAGAAPTELFFSEYIEGTSNNKALEIYNGTGSAVNLASGAYNVQMFFNGATTAGLTINLTGTVPAGDVFVLAHASANATILVQADQTNGAGWFNGDDAVVLRKGTSVIDSIGQVGFDPGAEWGTGATSTADNTLRRKAGVEAGDTNAGDVFDPSVQWDGFATDTCDGLGCAGTAACPPPPDPLLGMCGDPATLISALQGPGATTPVPGTQHTIEGIVVGDFDGAGGLAGFFVQEEDAHRDTDPLTSEGIFVAATGASVVGDRVRVRGTVNEGPVTVGGSMTRLGAVTGMTVCSSGNSVTTTGVNLPAPGATNAPTTFEPLEGMHVRLPQSLVISEYFNYDRFGEIVLGLPLEGESRHFTPTSIVEPGTAHVERFNQYLIRRITLDDGLGIQNPAFTRHPNGMGFSLSNSFRGGDRVANTVGVMSWDFSLWRIQPTGAATYTAANPRPGPLEAPEGIRVATMNTLNYFVTLDVEPNTTPPHPDDNKCGPARNLECRGADSNQPAEFDRQRTKLLAALAGLDADVIGLNELENTTGVDPLEDPIKGIVPGLNAMPGVGPYDAIDTGTIGGDAIKVGLIYRSNVVRPVGAFKLLTSAVDPRFIDTLSRPVLAQTFEVIATGARFTVAVNHLKSKGSACPGDPDIGDGQGNCNQTRKAAAEALVDWLATDPTGSDDPDFLIMGDLNAYAKEDPIDAVLEGPDDVLGTADDYTNLVRKFEGEFAYSFVFDGMAGYLDHGLANAAVVDQVLGAAEWHINADEPDLVDYDTSFKSATQDTFYEPNQFRSSDHDPLVVVLCADLTACATDRLADVVEEVEAMRASASGRTRARLGDVLEELEQALASLTAPRPNRAKAASHAEAAAAELQAAVRQGLVADSQANGVLDRLARAMRLLAVDAIEEAKARDGDATTIDEAEKDLAKGDARRLAGQFTNAIASYREAILRAENA